jgi:hypothetical protein
MKAAFANVEKPSPAMIRALRQGHLYGRLIERDGKLYAPGCASSAICTKDFAARMVSGGWLAADGKDYRLTEAGKLFVA